VKGEKYKTVLSLRPADSGLCLAALLLLLHEVDDSRYHGERFQNSIGRAEGRAGSVAIYHRLHLSALL
jgi:hypothetical protein